jgi:hypothetical protein
MNMRLFGWLAFGLVLGSLLGIAFGKGDPRAPLFVGAVGGVLGLVGFCAVSSVSRAWKIDAPRTNYLAILGALLGAICGGVIGAFSRFGRLMIAIFNPDLPERDFGTFFGVTGGIVLGALLGAYLVSAVAPLFRRPKIKTEETEETS